MLKANLDYLGVGSLFRNLFGNWNSTIFLVGILP
jgi:hypothetical protein